MGIDRSLYSIFEHSSKYENQRFLLSLKPYLSPFHIAIFPLVNKNNLIVAENRSEGTWKGSLTMINLAKATLEILKDDLDTPTTVAIQDGTAWVLQAQFSHLFGDEKNIPPGPFEILGIQYKTSILTKIKKLLDFKN